MPAAQRFKSFEDLARALDRPVVGVASSATGLRTMRSLEEFLSLTSHVKRPPGAFREVLRADPCAYCGRRGGTIDHVEPRSRGGANSITNLTGACRRCNVAKGTTPLLLFLAGTLNFARPPARRRNRLVYSASPRGSRARRPPYRLPKARAA